MCLEAVRLRLLALGGRLRQLTTPVYLRLASGHPREPFGVASPRGRAVHE